MDSDDDLNDVTTSEIDEAKGRLPKVLILHGKEIISAIVIGVIISVFSSTILEYFSPDTESNENMVYLQSSSQVEIAEPSHRDYFVRASLANVLANINPVKTQIAMYFQIRGQFPANKDEIDISSFDLEEHDHIISSNLTDKGGIEVHLSKEFGDDKYLALQPNTSKNGAFIKWRCFTNVDEKYLGIPQNRMCEFQKSM